MRKQRFLSIATLVFCALALLSAGKCAAQFSSAGYQANTAKSVSSFEPLFEGLEQLIFNGAEVQNGALPVWDSRRNHYRGNLLSHFYHPEIPAAGYRRFSCSDLDRLYSFPDEKDVEPETFLQHARYALAREDSRANPVYEFDSAGWLRAIRQESLHPEYEAFTETVDNLFYDFRTDGTVQLRWQQQQHSSGRNFSATSECGKLPAFIQVYRQQQVIVMLDSFQNIRSVRKRTEERWDTCAAGGPKIWNLDLEYDTLGRLLQITRSNEKQLTPVSKKQFSYAPLSLSDFNRRMARNDTFKSFREPAVQHWLQSIPQLQGTEQGAIETFFTYYDSRVQKDIFRPDSPLISQLQTSWLFTSARRQPVAYLSPLNYEDFSFYIRQSEAGTGTPLLFVQQLPKTPVTTSNGVVCRPLTLKSSLVYRRNSRFAGTDTFTFFSAGRVLQPVKYVSQNTTITSSPEFVAALPKELSYQVQSASLKNKQGLLRYLWLPHKTYVLRYE